MVIGRIVGFGFVAFGKEKLGRAAAGRWRGLNGLL